jgi:hypothetical protein
VGRGREEEGGRAWEEVGRRMDARGKRWGGGWTRVGRGREEDGRAWEEVGRRRDARGKR